MTYFANLILQPKESQHADMVDRVGQEFYSPCLPQVQQQAADKNWEVPSVLLVYAYCLMSGKGVSPRARKPFSLLPAGDQYRRFGGTDNDNAVM